MLLAWIPPTFAAARKTASGRLAASQSSVSFWRERLATHQVAFTEEARFGDAVLRFADPDGLGLEIVATAEPDARQPWTHP